MWSQTDPPAPAPIHFPLVVSADRRRLVDQDGKPLLIQGDAAWGLIANTTLQEAQHYLDDRKAKGFSAVIISLIEYLFCQDPPRNRYGAEPFTTPGDFSTPNDEYMRHAEQVLQMTADRNLLVFLTPAYLGYPDHPSYPGYHGQPEGWYSEVLASGVDKCRKYGDYLAQRFGRFDNLIWQLGGDRNPGKATPMLTAMAEGLRAGRVKNLFTAHVLPECSPLDQPGMDWVDINLTYTYQIVHWKLHDDYKRDPVYPTLLVESSYEGEHNSSELQIRRQAYWSVLCGGNGHFLGNAPIWLFDPGWQAALDLPGSRAMAHFGEFFRALPWAELVPDLDRSIAVAGLGEARGLDRVTTAATPDGALAVSYLPAKRELRINSERLRGPVIEVSWFEPATGRVLIDQPIRPGGLIWLSPPFEEDCVLTLRSEPIATAAQ
ncbi:MAG: glycoside hydrolase family 140 protein [Actinomycetia bacterium]|nr:glycoside hydrolase family 140 protein [Actinomycetes bacterium]